MPRFHIYPGWRELEPGEKLMPGDSFARKDGFDPPDKETAVYWHDYKAQTWIGDISIYYPYRKTATGRLSNAHYSNPLPLP